MLAKRSAELVLVDVDLTHTTSSSPKRIGVVDDDDDDGYFKYVHLESLQTPHSSRKHLLGLNVSLKMRSCSGKTPAIQPCLPPYTAALFCFLSRYRARAS